MEYHPRDRGGIAPWVWVLIVLAAIILIFVVWWAVAAQPQQETVVVPPAEQEPIGTPPQQQPVVIERERPVNIYIERDEPRPNVIIVPRDEQPAQAQERLRQIDLPDRFRFMDRTWEPTEQAVTREDEQFRDTGANVNGNVVYAREDAMAPYDELFLESEPGSGIYVRYRPE